MTYWPESEPIIYWAVLQDDYPPATQITTVPNFKKIGGFIGVINMILWHNVKYWSNISVRFIYTMFWTDLCFKYIVNSLAPPLYSFIKHSLFLYQTFMDTCLTWCFKKVSVWIERWSILYTKWLIKKQVKYVKIVGWCFICGCVLRRA